MATACDLRFAGEEAARTIRETVDDHALVVRDLANRLHRAITEPVYLATFHDTLAAIVSRLEDEANRLNGTAVDSHDRVETLVERVRNDFHRAVDERVEETINEGDYTDADGVREAISEAIRTFRTNLVDGFADFANETDTY